MSCKDIHKNWKDTFHHTRSAGRVPKQACEAAAEQPRPWPGSVGSGCYITCGHAEACVGYLQKDSPSRYVVWLARRRLCGLASATAALYS